MCFSSGAAVTGSGCFREDAGALAKARRKCLRHEIGEELPKLKVGPVKLWKEVTAKNHRSGRRMSDAIFVTKKISGSLELPRG